MAEGTDNTADRSSVAHLRPILCVAADSENPFQPEGREHGIVNQHFQCSERYRGGSVDDLHALWIPSASMHRRTGAHIRRKSAGRQPEARGHITPCSSLPSTVK